MCVKEQNKCDRVSHCRSEGGEDETNCSQKATSWCEGSDCDKAYKPPTGGHCEKEEEVLCTARDGKFAGKKICVEKKFQCDNHLQCEDGKDEEDCETEYKNKRIFKRDHDFICTSLFLNTSNKNNDKFFPMRAIGCDTIPQCPNGEDEEGCTIPESARLIMSLIIIIMIIVIVIATLI